MFGIGSTELLIILVVAIVVIGPKKLPEMMRTLGKGMAEFKRVSTDVKDTLDKEVRQAEEEIKKQEREVKEAAKKAAFKDAESVLKEPEKTETPKEEQAEVKETKPESADGEQA